MENINLKNIIEETIKREVKKAILESTTSNEVYFIKNNEGEPVEQFETEEEAEKALEVYKKEHPDQELIIEKGKKLSFEELDSMSEKLENMENIEETSKQHKGHFTMEQVMALAERAGKTVPNAKSDFEELCEMHGEKIPAQNVFEILEDYDMSELMSKIKVKEMDQKEGNAFTAKLKDTPKGEKFKLGDKTYTDTSDMDEEEEACEGCSSEMGEDELDEGQGGMCEKCGKELCECGSGMYESKKSVRLSEAELVKLISGMVNEAVPGLTAFQKAHKESGSQNNEALSDVEKRIKDYLTFDGNDNPEFPGHNKGEVEARQTTDDEADEIADNRGGGLEDLDYDVEPSDKFKERLEMSLKGDAKMGNGQKDAGNVIPSDLGDKMIKKVKRKKEAKEEAPMYVKDPAPFRNVNESVVISEEVKRMKEMFSYNKKTQ
jgi:hypothetical protein